MRKDIRKNPIMLTDCYNTSHQFYKESTDYEVSHMYNRAKPQVLYGFQENILEILNIRITKEMVAEAATHADRMGLLFPVDLWEKVVNECHGYLPLKIQMLPEGTYCPKGTPFAQISNTVEGYGELVTWLEPILMQGYFPSSCATRALEMKEYLLDKQRQYGFDDGFLWRFHSFGFRGHRTLEDAYWAGTAWSMFLAGTDDFHIARHMPSIPMGSIGALAHKVTQQFDREMDCFTRAIDQTAAQGKNIVALVIDTYDAQRVINEYVAPLARYAKAQGVHLVFRPDSGDVFAQAKNIYDVAVENSLTNVSVIIGEGMSFENAKSADVLFEELGVPLTFINYGIGGGFYKDLERDTLGWAMKTAYSNGADRMKVVKSDPFKQSIPGVVDINRTDRNLTVVPGAFSDFSEYIDIYSYNPNTDALPKMKNVDNTHYMAVAARAASYPKQEKIVISDATQKVIDAIVAKY